MTKPSNERKKPNVGSFIQKTLSELAPPFASDDKLNFDLIVLARNEHFKA